MVFEIPEGLHPDCYPLAWLIGTWRGKGSGEYPGIEPFQFAQEVTFNHDGRPFLNYFSRSWIINDENEILRPGGSETGFWRPKENKTLEVVLAHNTGLCTMDQRFKLLWIKVIPRRQQRLLLLDNAYMV